MMKAAVLQSNSEEMAQLISELDVHLKVHVFDTGKDLLGAFPNEGFALVVLDLDEEGSVVEEINKKIHQDYPDTLRLFKAKKMNEQLLSKHRDSPEGGDYYFVDQFDGDAILNCLNELDILREVVDSQAESSDTDDQENTQITQGTNSEISLKIQDDFDRAFDDLEGDDEATVVASGQSMDDSSGVTAPTEQLSELGSSDDFDEVTAVGLELDSDISETRVASDELEATGSLNQENSDELPDLPEIDLQFDSTGNETETGHSESDAIFDDPDEKTATINFGTPEAAEDQKEEMESTQGEEMEPDFGAIDSEEDENFPEEDDLSATHVASGTDEEGPIKDQDLSLDEKSLDSMTRSLSVDALKQLDDMDELINETKVGVLEDPFEDSEQEGSEAEESPPEIDLDPNSNGQGQETDIEDTEIGFNSGASVEDVYAPPNHESFRPSISESQLESYGNTIGELSADRKELLNKIHHLEKSLEEQKLHLLNYKTESEEKSIENSLLKKKLQDYNKGRDQKLSDLQHHNEYLIEKNRSLQFEIKKLNKVLRVDVNAVRAKEKELENQLELLRSDSSFQIKNREKKIAELKQKIDALVFELNSVNEDYRERVQGQQELENKLTKVVSNLKGAIDVLEENQSVPLGLVKNLKKNINM